MKASSDPFHLNRFTLAQEGTYDRALSELKSGQKRSHWMWYIFPQLDGLGHSETTRYYAIKSREEAAAYLKHPILGPRLVTCAKAILRHKRRSVSEIFGYPDDVKLRSSMTLFAAVSASESIFARVLGQFFNGYRDDKTRQLLEIMKAEQTRK